MQVYQESKTFARKQAAQAWTRSRETELDQPGAIERANRKGVTIKDVINRYLLEMEKVRPLGKTKRATLVAISVADFGNLKDTDINSQRLVEFARWRMSANSVPLRRYPCPTPQFNQHALLVLWPKANGVGFAFFQNLLVVDLLDHLRCGQLAQVDSRKGVHTPAPSCRGMRRFWGTFQVVRVAVIFDNRTVAIVTAMQTATVAVGGYRITVNPRDDDPRWPTGRMDSAKALAH